jgi:murein DD-endopeptidase MepM/ murein hydrolase activator NlpD
MTRSTLRRALLLALPLIVLPLLAEAQVRGSGGPGSVERREGDVKATGLTPVFPDGHVCAPIASPFASPSRYDGSPRRDERFGGLHGGIDLTLREGTPLLAVAAGTVIARGEGGRLEGIYLWLMHAPADTGLPHWIYTKYQHLSGLPTLHEGDRVRVGQVVALSGKTGTTGGHYGAAGYPHLHLSLAIGPSDEYQRVGAFGSMVKARGAQLADPLMLYLPEVEDVASVASLPDDRKRVRIPVVGGDGAIDPAGSKVVWPVRCRRTGAN